MHLHFYLFDIAYILKEYNKIKIFLLWKFFEIFQRIKKKTFYKLYINLKKIIIIK
uniref:Uncharacterized protein n=1 Tax=Octopus bimaculoides TaxID=37653 RepID=A0A0L8GY03_OCTBM